MRALLDSCRSDRPSIWTGRIQRRRANKASPRQRRRVAHATLVRWASARPAASVHGPRWRGSPRTARLLQTIERVAPSSSRPGRQRRRSEQSLVGAHRGFGDVEGRPGTARLYRATYHDDARRRPTKERTLRVRCRQRHAALYVGAVGNPSPSYSRPRARQSAEVENGRVSTPVGRPAIRRRDTLQPNTESRAKDCAPPLAQAAGVFAQGRACRAASRHRRNSRSLRGIGLDVGSCRSHRLFEHRPGEGSGLFQNGRESDSGPCEPAHRSGTLAAGSGQRQWESCRKV